MRKPTKVIDLFAGPGGLGEGFSSFHFKQKSIFNIAISIEKEDSAYRTLLLRALFRQFNNKDIPEAYYSFLRGELGKNPEDELYHLPEIQDALKKARTEAQKIILGEDKPEGVYNKIRNVLSSDECIVIGGPPCQAYSLVGRSRNYGEKSKQYTAKEDHRNFLYLEYLKIIAKFQPKIFVMENVKGILSAKIDGKLIFDSILQDLQDPYKATKVTPDSGRKKHQYKVFSLTAKNTTQPNTKNVTDSLNPHDYIIRSENYGIPQARHRVILLGIRDDIASGLNDFQKLEPSKNQPTVSQVISDLPKLRSRLSKVKDNTDNWRTSIDEIKNTTFPLLKNDPLVSKRVLTNLNQQINKIKTSPKSVGGDKGLIKKNSSYNELLPKNLYDWYKDPLLKNHVVNHETRGHIASDLHRYIYYSTYAKIMKKSPNAKNLPMALWPNHNNFSSGKFSDRFRVQLSDAPGSTVTSHISKDGHYFIHYDPTQCRSLTVREAARIQTFPDNYYFVGTRTQQYVQVGNAVPPFLAWQIAQVVHNLLK